MQRIFVLSVLLLSSFFTVLCQEPLAPPDLQLWVFNRALETIDVFDSYDGIAATITTNCPLSGYYYDAAVASDGNIWFSTATGLQAIDPETRNCTIYIDLAGTFTSFGHVSPGLGGKYLYYLGDGDIWRMDLITYQSAKFLAPPFSTLFFNGFGFQNNKMYSSLQYFIVETEFQILNSFDYDFANDEPLLPAITEDSWEPRPTFQESFFKFKKCPRSSEYFCGIPTVSGGQWVWSSLVNGSDPWIVIDTYVPSFYGAYFFDYFTAPWGFMYASDDNGGLYSYNWTTPSPPTSMTPNIIEPSTGYGNIVALIGSPYINVQDFSGVCFADVYFNSYYWTTKYAIEVKNSVTGLYEEVYTMPDYSSNEVETRYVNLEVVCDAPNKSYRIRYEGDTDMSDNVYSIPTTVPCSCVSAPIAVSIQANILPILECIEKVDSTNYVIHVGYENTEAAVAYIPVGDSNKFSDFADRGQPTFFREGRTNFFPTPAFSFAVTDSAISWYLSYYQLPIDTQNTDVYCPSSLRVQLKFFYSLIDPNESNIELVRLAIAEYLQISESRVKINGFEVTPVTKRAGSGNNVDLEAEISQAGPDKQEPSASDSVKELVQVAKNQTAGDKIIDPKGVDPDSEILGVKPLPTGVEQSGSAQPGATPGAGSNSPGTKTSGVTSATVLSSVLSLFLGIAFLHVF